MTTAPAEDRNARRRERTRAALVRAAQEILVSDGDIDASIQSITDRADVGFGSFYNHFENKSELFETALAEAAQQYGDWLDVRLGDETDPLRRLTRSIRLTGRLHLEYPHEADVLIRQLALPRARAGLLPGRLRADVTAAIAAVRRDASPASPIDVTAISAVGAIAAVLRAASQLLDDARVDLADALAADILRLLGVAQADIVELVNEPIG